ncbi:MAG TPA: MFS transporter [Gaiellaceae bacterium]|nr:MFS transporter [Gaiellaceae bacterium]
MTNAAVARRLGLVARVPSFRLLFLATLGSGFGTWLAFIGLAIDVKDRTDSGPWVSALLIADVLPAVVIGLLAGPLVDRLSRKGLMVGADLLRAAIFALLPFAGSAAVIVALAALAGVGTGLFRPAVYAGLPNLVEDEDLPRANGLIQGVENFAWAIGPLLGGALVAASGPDLAYWVNAGTFLVSALLVSGIPARVLQAGTAESHGHWRDLLEGFAFVLRTQALVTVLVVWSVFMLASAGINVAEVFLAKDTFDSGDFGYGLLVGATGLGLVLGSLAAGPLLDRHPLARVYPGSILLVALAVAAGAVAPNVWIAAGCVLVVGAANGAAVVCNALLVQRGSPDALRGRVFTVLMSSSFGVLALGMVVSGPLTDAVGPRLVWGAAAALAGLSATLALLMTRRAQPYAT